MGEIKTTDAGGTLKTTQSSETTAPKSDSAAKAQKAAVKGRKETVTVNARGVPTTVWDNPKNDPNKRAHVGDDPEGKKNKLVES